MNQKVCSLELSIKLRDLGVIQESEWVWADLFQGYSLYSEEHPNWQLRKGDDEAATYAIIKQRNWCAAFTMAELEKRLLEFLKRNKCK